jgi:UDP-sugar transporter A1/2/3
VAQYGVLQGFDHVVWLIVMLNGLGGLLVAATMKYADNIVKCFAAALAILSGTLLSVPIFGFELSATFSVGVACTVSASTLYSWAPNVPAACVGASVGGAKGGSYEMLPTKNEPSPSPAR